VPDTRVHDPFPPILRSNRGRAWRRSTIGPPDGRPARSPASLRRARRRAAAFLLLFLAGAWTAPVAAQVKAKLPPAASPSWNKGIQPISRESYWHAVECGKQGGENPGCVFYDSDLCKNEDYTLALYTPYKMVAYTVWQAVRKNQPPPTPSYPEAQRTRVVLGVTPVRGARNPLTAVTLKRGGRTVAPGSTTIDAGRGTFVFDFPAFAPTASVTIEMVGRARTVSCVLDRAVLARLR
jgi:hypothetical protein